MCTPRQLYYAAYIIVYTIHILYYIAHTRFRRSITCSSKLEIVTPGHCIAEGGLRCFWVCRFGFN